MIPNSSPLSVRGNEASRDPHFTRSVPFVGRDFEMQVLVSALDQARRAQGRFLLVVGEPGLGKTRLLNELAEAATTREVNVVAVRCRGAAPGSPLTRILQAVFQSDGADADKTMRTFDAFARRSPMALLLDDLESADGACLGWLQTLGGMVANLPILVVGTTSAAACGTSVRTAPSLLARPPRIDQLTLRPLQRSDVIRITTAVLSCTTPRLLQSVYERTNGHPLFVLEVLDRLAAGCGDSPSHRRRSAWPVPVSRAIRATAAAYLAPLSRTCQELLSIASVISREFAFERLQHLVMQSGLLIGSSDQGSLIQLVEEAVDRGVLDDVFGTERRYRFRYALVQEVLCEALGPRYRSILRRGTATREHHVVKARRLAGDRESGALDTMVEEVTQTMAVERVIRLCRTALDVLHRNAANPTDDRSEQALVSEAATETIRGVIAVESGEARVFRRQGDYWTIAHGGVICRLKATKGLDYLAQLLQHPDQDVPALDLLSRAHCARPQRHETCYGTPAVHAGAVNGSGGSVLDATAKTTYRQRIAELLDELAEAERFNDLGRSSRAREEVKQLEFQLAGAVGIRGQDRPVRSDAERARLAVTKRIKDAIRRIREVNPDLGRHLSLHVKTGFFCGYRPDGENQTVWDVKT